MKRGKKRQGKGGNGQGCPRRSTIPLAEQRPSAPGAWRRRGRLAVVGLCFSDTDAMCCSPFFVPFVQFYSLFSLSSLHFLTDRFLLHGLAEPFGRAESLFSCSCHCTWFSVQPGFSETGLFSLGSPWTIPFSRWPLAQCDAVSLPHCHSLTFFLVPFLSSFFSLSSYRLARSARCAANAARRTSVSALSRCLPCPLHSSIPLLGLSFSCRSISSFRPSPFSPLSSPLFRAFSLFFVCFCYFGFFFLFGVG